MPFEVEGGIHLDPGIWKQVIPGSEEFYGPFETFEQAKEEWKRRMFGPKLDIAGHRLFIRKT